MKNTIDNKDTIISHAKTIRNKFILNMIYKDFYQKILSVNLPKGKIVELGSGGGFIKEINPKIVTSDVVHSKNIDKVFKAEKMPFKSSGISAFYLLNTFHHIKNPTKALTEMERCLKKSGKIVMIEPFNSPWARFIYQNFHQELFDPKTRDWKIMGRGRLSSANGAIPWVIFVRDVAKFTKKFPNLKINSIKPHTPFSYLVSGGLSRPQIIPSNWYNFFFRLEQLISPLNKIAGMFATYEIVKR